MRIYLIGYKCSGKSTIGPMLAEKLGIEFVDLDSFIEKKHGKSIPELFRMKDEITFRQMERDAFLELLKTENTIIATGGGFPCWFNNMELMNHSGITIYLNVDNDILYQRMQRISSQRPVLKGLKGFSLKGHIKKLKNDYEHIYNKAHIIHDYNYGGAEILVNKIKLYLHAFIHN